MRFFKKHFVLFFFFLPVYTDSLPEKVGKIEKIIQQDPGNRGVNHFYTTALFDAANCLNQKQQIAILTGFFIPSAQRPETDGPLGAVFLAQSLTALGKKVTIVTDEACIPAITACLDLLPSSEISVAIFPQHDQEVDQFVSTFCQTIDCLLSIERVGRTFDGTYRSMRAINITDQTAPLDDLFIHAKNHPELEIATVSIGDGGNEIGMGSKIDEIQKYVLNGESIACVIPADHLIVTGVSNWGGYALAGALYCIASEENSALSLSQVFPSIDEQQRMLYNMVERNCCDGVLGKAVPSVDGLSWELHEKILVDILEILNAG